MNSVRFTRTVGSFHPKAELLLAFEDTDRVLQELYKGFVRKEFFPHFWIFHNDRFVNGRENNLGQCQNNRRYFSNIGIASSSLEQTQHILRCLFTIEGNIIQVKRKAGIDVVRIIDG